MDIVLISGKPASGKTTGARFLDPKKTFYIDVDGKGLWTGAKKDYNAENKNYAKMTSAPLIFKAIKNIHDNAPHINCVVVDTISTVMSDAEMDILKNPSRDQWADLAVEIYELFRLCRGLNREDFVVIFMSHVEEYDVNGIANKRIKVNGKKLSKLNLNSFLKYNLYSEIIKEGSNFRYVLRTVSDGTDECRAPMGMFEPIIENNLNTVVTKILEENDTI